jgi:hypothetical protein
MFRGLRFQLTLLYLLAALGLILLLGGGTYLLLHNYFQASTDLALRFRMAQEFQARGQSLPPDLAGAASAWSAQRALVPASAVPLPTSTASRAEDEGEEGSGDGESSGGEPASELELAETERYDGELTAIFALPVTAQALLVSNPNLFAPPVAPDVAAVAAALAKGSDLRTVHASDGSEVRAGREVVAAGGAGMGEAASLRRQRQSRITNAADTDPRQRRRCPARVG